MLHIVEGNREIDALQGLFQSKGGFTLLEMILVFGISSLLVVSLLSLFFNGFTFYSEMTQRSEQFHHLRAGLGTLVDEVQKANPEKIVLLREVTTSVYTEIQFYQYGSDDFHWFYVNSAKTLIHAIQRPGEAWGKLVIAEGIENISISEVIISTQSVKLLRFKLTSLVNQDSLVVETTISPGF